MDARGGGAIYPRRSSGPPSSCDAPCQARNHISTSAAETAAPPATHALATISSSTSRCRASSSPASRNYAENIGRALQITNILRDVGEDLKRDRIYLPLDDLRQFGCSEDQLIGHTHDEHFVKLMEFQAKRAEQLFEEAELNITQADRLALRPAMIMAAIYRRLLSRMRADGFRVFDRRYRIGKPSKLLIGLRHLFA